MPSLKQKILQIIQKPNLANFATITPDGKPWTRYVMIITDDNMNIRFATFLNSRKVKQIKENPEVHLCCGVTDMQDWQNYLQIQGKAILSTDQKEKQAIWNPELAQMLSGPDDPSFGVIIIEPYRIEYYEMDKLEPEIWKR
ncbi:MAG: pyridoxamine 5'-phosphate oxidase family protein [Gammaproteobacteria bacterium]|jgi:general stress protein 26